MPIKNYNYRQEKCPFAEMLETKSTSDFNCFSCFGSLGKHGWFEIWNALKCITLCFCKFHGHFPNSVFMLLIASFPQHTRRLSVNLWIACFFHRDLNQGMCALFFSSLAGLLFMSGLLKFPVPSSPHFSTLAGGTGFLLDVLVCGGRSSLRRKSWIGYPAFPMLLCPAP